MDQRAPIKWALLALTGVVLGACGLVPGIAQAQGPNPTPEMWIPGPDGERIPWNTPGGPAGNQPAQGTPVPPGGGDGGWQLPNVPQIITQLIKHVMVFPTESLREALEKAVAGILRRNLEFMRAPLTTALRYTVFSTPTIRGGSLGPAGESILWLGQNPFEDAWHKVRTVTFFLYPLLLAIAGLNVVARNALGASWQSEDLGEVLVKWVFVVLASGLSIYLCDWVNRLANALAGVFLAMPDVDYIVDVVIIGAVTMLAAGGGGIVGLLLAIFMAVVGLSIVVALIMQYVARYVLLYILVAIAPLGLLALGLDQTRWLGYLWIKGFVLVTLLQPISALIFALMHMIAVNGALNALVDPIGSFVKFGVAIGVLSVLLAINYAIIRGVFGAIGEVVSKGKDTAMAVGGMVMRTVMVVGGAVAGGVGLLGAGAGSGALAGAGGGGAGAGAGGSGTVAGSSGSGASGAGGAGAVADAGPGAGNGGQSGLRGLFNDRGRLGQALEMAGSGLFGGRSATARSFGDLMRTGGRMMQRSGAEERRRGEKAEHDAARQQEMARRNAAFEERQTTQERRREYTDYARQMTRDPRTQRDIVAAMDTLAQTWGHSRVRESLPAVAHAINLATGGGSRQKGQSAPTGRRTSLPQLAEERGYVSATGTPLPAHFVAGEVERDLIGQHPVAQSGRGPGGPTGTPQFAPPQAGRVAVGQPPSAANQPTALGQKSPPTYFDYRWGAQIAKDLGLGTERGAIRVYGSLYSSLRQDLVPSPAVPGIADGEAARRALADHLVQRAPEIARLAHRSGESPQGLFVSYVDRVAQQYGLTSNDLGDAWASHAGVHRLEQVQASLPPVSIQPPGEQRGTGA